MFRLPRQSCSDQLWRSPRSRTAPTGNVLLSDSPTGRSSLPMCLALATTFRFFIWKEYLKYLITTFFRSTMLCWSEVEDCRTCPMCRQSVSEENMTCPTWSRRASLHPIQKQHLQSHDCESDILQVNNMFKIFYKRLPQPGEKTTWKS